MLAADSVDSSELVNGSVDLSHMSVNSVDSDQYVDGSIDLAHMSANSIDSDQYVDGSIDTAHIANDAVDGTKLANNIDIAGTLDVTSTATFDGNIDLAGNIDVDGTCEADAYTVDGTALNEYIADTVGAMVGSNTETNIAVTYEDSDNTLDFVIGTLNQDTSGTAAIATTVTVADESSDTSNVAS